MQCVTLPRITELNPHLLCVLCGGYYIDATSIIECLHAFCKSCIVRYLETHKYCPICDVLVHKTEPLQNIRPDVIRQSIVYKLVPNLYKKEMRNRRNFYVQVNPQQHPACSESKGEITETSNFFSLDDVINLSLEYVNSINEKNFFFVAKGSKRYFRCRAAVTIRTLRKLLAAKYALGVEHKIRMFLDGIQLPDHFKLLDIAYMSSWKRVGYIRILYEILISDQDVTCAEKVDLCETESLTDECKKEVIDNAIAAVPAIDVDAEKCENSCSILKTETIDVELPISSHRSPTITVDLTSPSSEATIVNIPSPPKDDVTITNSSTEPPPAASSPKSVSAIADEAIPPAAKEVVVASVDLTDIRPSEKTESSQDTKSSAHTEEEQKTAKPSVERTDETAAVETNASAPLESSQKLPAPLSTAAHEAKVVEPVQALATKETPKNPSSKEERRGDRSECLPPVPALRMINTAPVKRTTTKPLSAPAKPLSAPTKPSTTTAKSSTITTKPSTTPTKPPTTKKSITITTKPLTSVCSSRSQPLVSIPRMQSAPRASNKSSGGYPTASVAAPLSLMPPTIPVATDLISLYAKSPTVRQPQPKKPPPAGLSILRIDPKTLSPIEASSSPPAAAVVPAGSGARKMLPCRPMTSSAYNSVYSCAGATALHPFGKFSSPPLYPPFPPSSLHPMNELVRRMFPFPFGSMEAALKPPPLDSSICGLTPYPQSMTSALNHFLTAAKPPATPAKQTKCDKGRRKSTVAAALNGGEKAQFKGGAVDSSRGYRRATAPALTNGQIKNAVKRKNSELSDFSINNLIPVDDGAKRAAPPLAHACTADGVNEVCDQMQPVSAAPAELRKSS